MADCVFQELSIYSKLYLQACKFIILFLFMHVLIALFLILVICVLSWFFAESGQKLFDFNDLFKEPGSEIVDFLY
jgi:hypothetical protein